MRRLPVVVVLLVAAGAALWTVRERASGNGYSTTYGATVVRYTLDGRLVGRHLHEIGVVPPGGGRRPLLVLLHGRHDPSRLSWLVPDNTGPETLLSDQLFAALKQLGSRAPIVVLLDGGAHGYWHDRRGGRWASMGLDEAIPDAVRRFHTRPGRIAVGGISMGGYGALHLASLRPREFCAVGGHSASLWTSAGATAPGAFDDAADYERNDVFAAARHGRFDHLPVWLDGGTKDPFRSADAAFASLLRSRGVRVTYHLWPGAHTTGYWRSHMAAYLDFYTSALARCATARSATPGMSSPSRVS